METTMDNEDVRSLVSAHATRYQAPTGLADRIADALPAKPSHADRGKSRFWRGAGLGAATMAALAVALGSGLMSMQPSRDDVLVDEAVANHVRSLQAGHAVDVASSDQHTVKPWFNGKIDYAAPAFDLGAEGFPLVGGRLDYFDGEPIAVLVYRYRLHTINVFVRPAKDGSARPGPRTLDRRGFAVLRWTKDGMEFWVVSDADAATLAQLRTLMMAEGRTR
jgi:anti-sigma factor RsiW